VLLHFAIKMFLLLPHTPELNHIKMIGEDVVREKDSKKTP